MENGNAYLYDSLADAVAAVESGRGASGDTPAAITLLKTTDETVTIDPDTKFTVKPISDDETIQNNATFETEDGYEVTVGEDGQVSAQPIPVESVALDQTEVTLYSNADPKTVQLTATVTPDNAADKAVTWSSGSEAVATVSDTGLVTAVADGTAVITATSTADPDKTATCTVTVSTYTAPSTGGSGVTRYAVSVPSDVEGGTVKVSPTRASRGQTVTITVTPDEGYELDTLTVTDADGKAVELTDKGDGKFTFTMPRGKVSISASFKAVEEEPQPSGLPFTDVAAGTWYTDAVAWAASEGVVNGVGDGSAFAPNDTITREQMAVMLYRYAQYKGYDVTQGGMAAREYEDYESISSWAVPAVEWAVNAGLISGTSATTLSPQGSATRAEIATILMRFVEIFVSAE